MSIAKWGVWTIAGILLGAGVGYWTQPSPLTAKVPLQDQLRPRIGAYAQKPNQSLRARIVNLDDLPEDASQEMRLELTVIAQRAVDSAIDLRLQLPPGVVLVSGLGLNERLTLVEGETWSRPFTVRGLARSTPSVIKAELSAVADGAAIGGEAYFSTHPIQADLSRRALPSKKGATRLQKAAVESERGEARLPAGIQF